MYQTNKQTNIYSWTDNPNGSDIFECVKTTEIMMKEILVRKLLTIDNVWYGDKFKITIKWLVVFKILYINVVSSSRNI